MSDAPTLELGTHRDRPPYFAGRVAELAEHGVLTLRAGRVSFGIPSFRAHMNNLLETHCRTR